MHTVTINWSCEVVTYYYFVSMSCSEAVSQKPFLNLIFFSLYCPHMVNFSLRSSNYHKLTDVLRTQRQVKKYLLSPGSLCKM